MQKQREEATSGLLSDIELTENFFSFKMLQIRLNIPVDFCFNVFVAIGFLWLKEREDSGQSWHYNFFYKLAHSWSFNRCFNK